MKADVVNAVFPVIDYSLAELVKPVGDTDADDIPARVRNIQAEISDLIKKSDAVEDRWKLPERRFQPNRGLHYVLVSWVDEVFSSNPSLGSEWGKRFLVRGLPRYRQDSEPSFRAVSLPNIVESALEYSFGELDEVIWLLYHLGFTNDLLYHLGFTNDLFLADAGTAGTEAEAEEKLWLTVREYWKSTSPEGTATAAPPRVPDPGPQLASEGEGGSLKGLVGGFVILWVFLAAAALFADAWFR